MKKLFCFLLIVCVVFIYSPAFSCSSGGSGDSGGSSGGSGDSGGSSGGSGDSGGTGGTSGSVGAGAGVGAVGADSGDIQYAIRSDYDEPGKDFGDSLAEHEPDWLIFHLFDWLKSDRCNNETGENCDWTLFWREKKYQPHKVE